MRIAVIGAGISGLTFALSLARKGFELDLFERAETLEEVGAGIQLSPNASRVLLALGLGEELSKCIVAPDKLQIGNGQRLNLLATLPLGDWARARYGAPYWLVHRADLQDILLKAVRRETAIHLHLGAGVDAFSEQDRDVTFQAVGEKHHADLIVGADGLRSVVRRQLVSGAEPSPSTHVAWRVSIDISATPGWLDTSCTTLWMGPGWHVVHYPIRRGERLNIVAIEPQRATGSAGPKLPHAAPEIATFFASQALREKWLPWPLQTVDPNLAWAKNRAVLLGDAAHAMLPTAAQGGAMGIEDAAVLSAEIAGDGSLPGKLARYELTRKPRVRKVVSMAESNLQIYTMPSLVAGLRNTALLALPGEVLMRRQDWLYSFTA
ncbi:salicylate hydroxylase [Rhodopseudomonas julia]|uniref:Salicylate hydroxylase n=1 Tax=Rhodopseudomonas julia TaxID=200617 RepID=A0ABU0C8K3_9BRAD|nr:FAD-dependent monooxygenase [Rhodopseudomonas julia]MDQ0326863.1 salicylate hydroxylase [Rhodopseudomonas julia]